MKKALALLLTLGLLAGLCALPAQAAAPVDGIAYCGDSAASTMTPAQAAAIRAQIDQYAAANGVLPAAQTVELDGEGVEFQCYALKDESGNLTNYIKLRDLALLLNGTAAQFDVGWDGAVTITTGAAYTPNGSELNTPSTGERPYSNAASVTKVNGQEVLLPAFVLTDDQGGGYTYYKLRDLGAALGFHVDWSADRGVFLETR